MTQIEKIKAEVERRWKELADKNVKIGGGKYDAEISTYLSLLSFIKSLEQEQTTGYVSAPCAICCYDKGCDTCEHYQTYIKAHCYQPSLPSNLDEAVHEYMEHIPESEPELMDSFYTWDQMEAAFKAGAEWMAGQGWISVDEKLPDLDEEVIVLTDEHNTAPIYKIGFGHIVDVERCIDYNGWNHPGVKYWMPCPKIPNND